MVVPPGHVCCFTDSENNYLFAKPGIHNITDPFLKQIGYPIPVQKQVIEHGNRTVVTIPQGMLGFSVDMGQPILLPPGLHSWTSETLRYERTFPLDEHIIEVGPYTILTVDEGCVSVDKICHVTFLGHLLTIHHFSPSLVASSLGTQQLHKTMDYKLSWMEA